ncbi:CHAP domain-containing protein [Faecalibaculum rodentium]|uniref:CHAP domain-containing protein n=1 Tax=Faecalibaculum rodentium TaxID=1702221 RepID=UPI0023F14184|nr:CHAP domain-containing protein [Faecalibaculum rodentium]
MNKMNRQNVFDLVDAGKKALEETIKAGPYVAGEGIMKTGYVVRNSVNYTVRNLSEGTRSVTANVLSQVNRYTPDFYDVGANGKDLTDDMGMFIAGNGAMAVQNTARALRIPGKYALKAGYGLWYNPLRMNHQQQKYQKFQNSSLAAKATYQDMVLGKSRKNVIHRSDRYAKNRYIDNFFTNLSARERLILMKDKFQGEKYLRLKQRSDRGAEKFAAMKSRQFSLKRSTEGMLKNQSRKLSRQFASGNDPESMVNQTAVAGVQAVRYSAKSAAKMYRRREMIKKYLSAIAHPIRTLQGIVSVIVSVLSAIFSMVASVPVVISIITALLPILVVVVIVSMLISTIFPSAGADEFNSVNVAMAATPEYASQAFIYEAKKREWKENAIVGTLAYLLAEGMGMGTFTYESYMFNNGPGKVTYDTTTDNQAWLEWLSGEGKTQALAQDNYNPWNVAIGLGVTQESNVWRYDTATALNASRLIDYCMKLDKPWQDPETQMTYLFKEKFSTSTAFDQDASGHVDPAKDDLTPEQWCRRVTAGIGMPGWTMDVNNTYMDAHISKVSEAQQIYDDYKTFSYVNMSGPAVNGNIDFTDLDAWIRLNPYAPTYYGQCTWFAWGRVYQIHGFAPNASGYGYEFAEQLYTNHPDRFRYSKTPAPGAVFSTDSASNHTGIVLDVQGDMLTIQDGNYNGVSDDFVTATGDWEQFTISLSGLKGRYSGLYFAVPV